MAGLCSMPAGMASTRAPDGRPLVGVSTARTSPVRASAPASRAVTLCSGVRRSAARGSATRRRTGGGGVLGRPGTFCGAAASPIRSWSSRATCRLTSAGSAPSARSSRRLCAPAGVRRSAASRTPATSADGVQDRVDVEPLGALPQRGWLVVPTKVGGDAGEFRSFGGWLHGWRLRHDGHVRFCGDALRQHHRVRVRLPGVVGRFGRRRRVGCGSASRIGGGGHGSWPVVAAGPVRGGGRSRSRRGRREVTG